MLALPSSSFVFAGGLACRIPYHLERPLAALDGRETEGTAMTPAMTARGQPSDAGAQGILGLAPPPRLQR